MSNFNYRNIEGNIILSNYGRGSGSLNRIYNFCNQRNPQNVLFCMFGGSIQPIPPVPVPKYIFYYKTSTINNFKSSNYDTELINNINYNKYQQFTLYNSNFTFNLGYLFSALSIFNSTSIGVYNTSQTSLIINGTDNSSINFYMPALNSSTAGNLNNGTYTYQITSGTGSFLNSSGYVILTINNTSTSKIEVYLE
jgi:hypothetical protein